MRISSQLISPGVAELLFSTMLNLLLLNSKQIYEDQNNKKRACLWISMKSTIDFHEIDKVFFLQQNIVLQMFTLFLNTLFCSSFHLNVLIRSMFL